METTTINSIRVNPAPARPVRLIPWLLLQTAANMPLPEKAQPTPQPGRQAGPHSTACSARPSGQASPPGRAVGDAAQSPALADRTSMPTQHNRNWLTRSAPDDQGGIRSVPPPPDTAHLCQTGAVADATGKPSLYGIDRGHAVAR